MGRERAYGEVDGRFNGRVACIRVLGKKEVVVISGSGSWSRLCWCLRWSVAAGSAQQRFDYIRLRLGCYKRFLDIKTQKSAQRVCYDVLESEGARGRGGERARGTSTSSS